MAVMQPFIYNCPAKLSGNWFPKEQNTLVTMIAVNANIFGVLMGFYVPKLCVKPNYDPEATYTDAELDTYRKQCFNTMFVIAAGGTLVTAILCLTFRSKPAESEDERKQINASNDLDETQDSIRCSLKNV